jgi:hypothetical protein
VFLQVGAGAGAVAIIDRQTNRCIQHPCIKLSGVCVSFLKKNKQKKKGGEKKAPHAYLMNTMQLASIHPSLEEYNYGLRAT